MNKRPSQHILTWIVIALIIQTLISYFFKVALSATVNEPVGILIALAFGVCAGFVSWWVDKNK